MLSIFCRDDLGRAVEAGAYVSAFVFEHGRGVWCIHSDILYTPPASFQERIPDTEIRPPSKVRSLVTNGCRRSAVASISACEEETRPQRAAHGYGAPSGKWVAKRSAPSYGLITPVYRQLAEDPLSKENGKCVAASA